MTARKPRLTDQLLADLGVAAQVLADESDSLASTLPQHAAHAALHDRLAIKHRAVQRSRDWLTRYLDAVREQRDAGIDDTETSDA